MDPAARDAELTILGNPVRSSGGQIPADRGYGIASVAGAQFAVPATDLDDPYPPVHHDCNGQPTTLRSEAGDVPFQALIAAAIRSADVRGCHPRMPEGLVVGGGDVDVWGVDLLGAMADAGLVVSFETPADARRDRWMDITIEAEEVGRRVLRLDAEFRTREALPVGFTTRSLAGGTTAVFPTAGVSVDRGTTSLIFLCDPTTTVQTEMPADMIADLLQQIDCQPEAPTPPRVPCRDLVAGFALTDQARALRVLEATAQSIPCQPG